MTPGLASCVGGIGAAPNYGEIVSKSFPLAHKPDCCLSACVSILTSVEVVAFLSVSYLVRCFHLKPIRKFTRGN